MEYYGDSAFVKVINELFRKNQEAFVARSIQYFDDNQDGRISIEEVCCRVMIIFKNSLNMPCIHF